MKEILKFKDNEIEYSLLNKNGKLVYQKLENGSVTNNLTKDEIELINNVLFSLLPSKNIKDLGIVKYAGKNINHLYDLDKKIHIFYENEFEITDDCLSLNAIFNNQEDYVSLANKRNYNSRYTRRRVKVGKKVLSVIVMSSFFLASSLLYIKGAQKIFYFVENYRYEKKVEEYSNRQIQVEEIVNAINSNINLTQEEKQFFLSCPEFFYDNFEYFDYYTVLDYLKRLRIEYIHEPSPEIGTYGKFMVEGKDRGLIKIYNSTCFEDAPKYALSHEFIHAFTKYSNDENYTYEGINVLMNNDYFGSLENNSFYDTGYSPLRQYIYLLAELIDVDVLRKYHADNDINYLKEDLVKIIPDENMATNLFFNLDFIARSKLLANSDMETYQKLSEEINLKTKEVQNTLKAYYETKYQISITNDTYAFFWLDGKSASTKIAGDLGFDFQAFLQADKLTRINQLKNIFNTTNDKNLVLALCDTVKEVPKRYTLEEVLNGDTGILYRTKEEIDLPLMEDGTYLGVAYEPASTIHYEVLSQKQLMNEKTK